MRKNLSLSITVLVLLSVVLTACAPATPAPAAQPAAPAAPAEPAAPSGKVEMFSWWTAGGEADGLNAMFDIYKKNYPGVEIINATVAGGAGTNAKAVLSTRLAGGDPPDSFQLHAGLEVEKYEPEKYLQPLNDLYASEGWDKAFPLTSSRCSSTRTASGAFRSTSTAPT